MSLHGVEASTFLIDHPFVLSWTMTVQWEGIDRTYRTFKLISTHVQDEPMSIPIRLTQKKPRLTESLFVFKSFHISLIPVVSSSTAPPFISIFINDNAKLSITAIADSAVSMNLDSNFSMKEVKVVPGKYDVSLHFKQQPPHNVDIVASEIHHVVVKFEPASISTFNPLSRKQRAHPAELFGPIDPSTFIQNPSRRSLEVQRLLAVLCSDRVDNVRDLFRIKPASVTGFQRPQAPGQVEANQSSDSAFQPIDDEEKE